MLRLKKALSLVAVSICLPCFSEVILQHAIFSPESCASSGQALSLPCKPVDVVSELSDYILVSRCLQCASKQQRTACSTALLSVPFARQPFVAMAHSVSSLVFICKKHIRHAAYIHLSGAIFCKLCQLHAKEPLFRIISTTAGGTCLDADLLCFYPRRKTAVQSTSSFWQRKLNVDHQWTLCCQVLSPQRPNSAPTEVHQQRALLHQCSPT